MAATRTFHQSLCRQKGGSLRDTRIFQTALPIIRHLKLLGLLMLLLFLLLLLLLLLLPLLEVL